MVSLENPAAPEYWSRQAFELRQLKRYKGNLWFSAGGQRILLKGADMFYTGREDTLSDKNRQHNAGIIDALLPDGDKTQVAFEVMEAIGAGEILHVGAVLSGKIRPHEFERIANHFEIPEAAREEARNNLVFMTSVERGNMGENVRQLRRLINRYGSGKVPEVAWNAGLTPAHIHTMMWTGKLTETDFDKIAKGLGLHVDEQKQWKTQFHFSLAENGHRGVDPIDPDDEAWAQSNVLAIHAEMAQNQEYAETGVDELTGFTQTAGLAAEIYFYPTTLVQTSLEDGAEESSGATCYDIYRFDENELGETEFEALSDEDAEHLLIAPCFSGLFPFRDFKVSEFYTQPGPQTDQRRPRYAVRRRQATRQGDVGRKKLRGRGFAYIPKLPGLTRTEFTTPLVGTARGPQSILQTPDGVAINFDGQTINIHFDERLDCRPMLKLMMVDDSPVSIFNLDPAYVKQRVENPCFKGDHYQETLFLNTDNGAYADGEHVAFVFLDSDVNLATDLDHWPELLLSGKAIVAAAAPATRKVEEFVADAPFLVISSDPRGDRTTLAPGECHDLLIRNRLNDPIGWGFESSHRWLTFQEHETTCAVEHCEEPHQSWATLIPPNMSTRVSICVDADLDFAGVQDTVGSMRFFQIQSDHEETFYVELSNKPTQASDSGFAEPALVGHWTFDQSALGEDSSDYDHHGVPMPPEQQRSTGRYDQALTQSIRIENAAALAFGEKDRVLVGAWIWPNAPTQAGETSVIIGNIGQSETDADDEDAPEGWELWMKSKTGKFGPELTFGYSLHDGLTKKKTVASLEPETWSHVAMLIQAGVARFYLNGQLVPKDEPNQQQITLSGDLDGGEPIVVGARARIEGERSHGFDGAIDDVRMYRGLFNSNHVHALWLGLDILGSIGAEAFDQSGQESARGLVVLGNGDLNSMIVQDGDLVDGAKRCKLYTVANATPDSILTWSVYSPNEWVSIEALDLNTFNSRLTGNLGPGGLEDVNVCINLPYARDLTAGQTHHETIAFEVTRGFDTASIIRNVNLDVAYAKGPRGLVGEWGFDDTLHDSTTFANHGTPHGDWAYADGIIDRAIMFDRSTQSVHIDADEVLNFALKDRFAISVWLKPDDIKREAFVLGNSIDGPGWHVFIDESGHVRFTVRGADGSRHHSTVSPLPLEPGWNHVVAFWDGSAPSSVAKLRVEINGQRSGGTQGSDVSGTFNIENPGPVVIGHLPSVRNGRPLLPYLGAIDQLRLYRGKLSDDQIRDLRQEPPNNRAPQLRIVSDDYVYATVGEPITVSAEWSDDGRPQDGNVTFEWFTPTDGATFSDPTASTTQITFNNDRSHWIYARVFDGELTSIERLYVTVQESPDAETIPTSGAWDGFGLQTLGSGFEGFNLDDFEIPSQTLALLGDVENLPQTWVFDFGHFRDPIAFVLKKAEHRNGELSVAGELQFCKNTCTGTRIPMTSLVTAGLLDALAEIPRTTLGSVLSTQEGGLINFQGPSSDAIKHIKVPPAWGGDPGPTWGGGHRLGNRERAGFLALYLTGWALAFFDDSPMWDDQTLQWLTHIAVTYGIGFAAAFTTKGHNFWPAASVSSIVIGAALYSNAFEDGGFFDITSTPDGATFSITLPDALMTPSDESFALLASATNTDEQLSAIEDWINTQRNSVSSDVPVTPTRTSGANGDGWPLLGSRPVSMVLSAAAASSATAAGFQANYDGFGLVEILAPASLEGSRVYRVPSDGLSLNEVRQLSTQALQKYQILPAVVGPQLIDDVALLKKSPVAALALGREPVAPSTSLTYFFLAPEANIQDLKSEGARGVTTVELNFWGDNSGGAKEAFAKMLPERIGFEFDKDERMEVTWTISNTESQAAFFSLEHTGGDWVQVQGGRDLFEVPAKGSAVFKVEVFADALRAVGGKADEVAVRYREIKTGATGQFRVYASFAGDQGNTVGTDKPKPEPEKSVPEKPETPTEDIVFTPRAYAFVNQETGVTPAWIGVINEGGTDGTFDISTQSPFMRAAGVVRIDAKPRPFSVTVDNASAVAQGQKQLEGRIQLKSHKTQKTQEVIVQVNVSVQPSVKPPASTPTSPGTTGMPETSASFKNPPGDDVFLPNLYTLTLLASGKVKATATESITSHAQSSTRYTLQSELGYFSVQTGMTVYAGSTGLTIQSKPQAWAATESGAIVDRLVFVNNDTRSQGWVAVIIKRPGQKTPVINLPDALRAPEPVATPKPVDVPQAPSPEPQPSIGGQAGSLLFNGFASGGNWKVWPEPKKYSSRVRAYVEDGVLNYTNYNVPEESKRRGIAMYTTLNADLSAYGGLSVTAQTLLGPSQGRKLRIRLVEKDKAAFLSKAVTMTDGRPLEFDFASFDYDGLEQGKNENFAGNRTLDLNQIDTISFNVEFTSPVTPKEIHITLDDLRGIGSPSIRAPSTPAPTTPRGSSSYQPYTPIDGCPQDNLFLESNEWAYALEPNVVKSDGSETMVLKVMTQATDFSSIKTYMTKELQYEGPERFVDILDGLQTIELNDDGEGPDLFSGDGVFTAGPFRYIGAANIGPYGGDPSSPAGIDARTFGVPFRTTYGGVSLKFIQPPVFGLVNPGRSVAVETLSDQVRISEHFANVCSGYGAAGRMVSTWSEHGVGDLDARTEQDLFTLSRTLSEATGLDTDFGVVLPAYFVQALGQSVPVDPRNPLAATETKFVYGAMYRAPLYGDRAGLPNAGWLALGNMVMGLNSEIFVHELLHHWAAPLLLADLGLSPDNAHYSPLSNVGSAPPLGGFPWKPQLPDGTYERDCDAYLRGSTEAAALDLYAMGIIDESEVPPILFAPQDTVQQENPHVCQEKVLGVVEVYTTADIRQDYRDSVNNVVTPSEIYLGFTGESLGRLMTNTEMTYFEILAEHATKTQRSGAAPHLTRLNWVPIERYFRNAIDFKSEVSSRR